MLKSYLFFELFCKRCRSNLNHKIELLTGGTKECQTCRLTSQINFSEIEDIVKSLKSNLKIAKIVLQDILAEHSFFEVNKERESNDSEDFEP